MRTTIALAAVVMLLAAAPAFARGHTPQTEFSGPGSAGSIQEQDMEGSQAKPNQNQNPNVQAPKSGTAQQPSQPDQQRDPQDPQMNPHSLHSMH